MEKLLLQISESKRRIVGQARHQSLLFDQYLASTLLIDGVPPPPWLLPPPHPESKREELISDILFPFPQAASPYSIGRNQPIFAADGEQSRVFTWEDSTAHGSPEARGGASVLPEVVGSHGCSASGAPGQAFSHPGGECPVNDAPEPIPTPAAKSPRDQIEASAPDSYYSLGQSLARVRRSKSRQKNIELHSSLRASKSSSQDECHTGVEPRSFAGSGDAHTLVDHMDDMELGRPTATDCSIHIMEEPKQVDCRSGGMGCTIAGDRSIDPIASALQPLCVDQSVNRGSPEKYAAQVLESSLEPNHRALEVVESPSVCSTIEDSRGKQKNSSSHCPNIGISQCSTRPYCEDEHLSLADSCVFGCDATVLTEEISHVDNRASEVVESPSIRSILEDSWGKQKNSSSSCANISGSQCSTRPYCEDELVNMGDSCLFGRDATVLTEEVSHVDTAGESEESSREQEPEVEFCQLDGDGLSGWHKSSVERASIMERLCKSTSLHTPSTQLSTAGPLHRGSNPYQSVPNGLLEYIDLKSTQPLEDDIIGLFKGGFYKRDIGHALDGKSFSDCLPVSDAENSRKPYASPVGKFWEKIASNSGSSKKKASLIPELPCISEENEFSDETTGSSATEIPLAVMPGSVKRKALAAITEDHNCPASVSELENGRYSILSVNTEFIFSGTNKRPEEKLGTNKRPDKRHTSQMRDSKAIPRGVRDTKLSVEALRNCVSQAKTSLQRDGLCTSVKEAKRGNIVSNMMSFVPLVQQKQAAVALTGKRDVKVKALEAADAARRQAEKREVERKMKKEALKLERARMEQEKIKQLELQRKRKEEEKEKKEAEIAARKRLREEEERREKERKRKRLEDARKHREEQNKKLCFKKEEKQIKKKATIGDEKKGANMKIFSENEGAKPRGPETVPEEGSLVPETPHHCSDNLKVTSFFNQGKVESFKEDEIKEQSYDISPYQCSDDEDEDEDEDEDVDAPRKFIPSWASKNCIALAISSQNSVDPDLIFPRDSFCSIDEVALPRNLRFK